MRQEVMILTIGHFPPKLRLLRGPYNFVFRTHIYFHTIPTMASPATLARMAAQVHITGASMPRNLTESKQLLGALQKFGEVITYRNLKVPRRIWNYTVENAQN